MSHDRPRGRYLVFLEEPQQSVYDLSSSLDESIVRRARYVCLEGAPQVKGAPSQLQVERDDEDASS